MSSLAFTTPLFLPATATSTISTLRTPLIPPFPRFQKPLPPSRLCMQQSSKKPSEEQESIPSENSPNRATSDEASSEGLTSASEILRTLREDSAQDPGAPSIPRSMLGVYRDVDGKSNIWAVEPREETDTSPQISKAVLIAIAAAFIAVALLVLPLLPLTNPDQA